MLGIQPAKQHCPHLLLLGHNTALGAAKGITPEDQMTQIQLCSWHQKEKTKQSERISQRDRLASRTRSVFLRMGCTQSWDRVALAMVAVAGATATCCVLIPRSLEELVVSWFEWSGL